MQLSVNGVAQTVYDDIMNGVAKTLDELTNVNTYEGMGWDFASVWGMSEDSNYPELQHCLVEIQAVETHLVVAMNHKRNPSQPQT